jgi:hypothetical protein
MTSGHSKASRKQSAEEELDVGNVSDEKMSELSAELELQKERARLEKLLAEKEVEQAILKELLALSNKKKRKRKKRNS